ncbi:MAG: bifunctional pyr operon transcriptional regulator/uracil phosphoribosyltransferase PyrR [Verrucomicrobia bacterium]|nr:bifunctional pyr operon transcriptional regulator/uracil phosphoribosyltransferase PyrR [Verrucomicrobiota bacterium]
MGEPTVLLDSDAVSSTLHRLASEIAARNPDPVSYVLVGVLLRGVALAERLAKLIGEQTGRAPRTASIDVSMHRDDLSIRRRLPSVRETKLPLELNNLTLILVDDVLFTGRTCRAALDAINSFGRPARIQLAALLDRGHRELPIQPDYVGKTFPTQRQQLVRVRLQETDHEPDSVLLIDP